MEWRFGKIPFEIIIKSGLGAEKLCIDTSGIEGLTKHIVQTRIKEIDNRELGDNILCIVL